MAPHIDMSPLRDSPASPGAARCTEAINEACEQIGFFVVSGHGLGRPLEQVFEAANSFFDSPQETKEQVPRIGRYGYIPLAGAAMDASRPANKGTESIDMGLGDECPLPELPGFANAVREYQRSALAVAQVLLTAIANALGAGSDFFSARMRHPQCRLRLLHYPAMALDPDGSLQVTNSPHTDYGAITLLATDSTPGLEVKSREGTWIPIDADGGSLIVNLGDMLARWTNDRYISTPHRVLSSPETNRISIPFFVNPDPATIVECIPSCVSPSRPCRYDPITAGEFLASRIDGVPEPYVDPQEGPARTLPI